MLELALLAALAGALPKDTKIEALPCAPAVAPIPTKTSSVGWASPLEPKLYLGLVRWRACALDAEDRAAALAELLEQRNTELAEASAPMNPIVWVLVGAAIVAAAVGGVAVGLELGRTDERSID